MHFLHPHHAAKDSNLQENFYIYGDKFDDDNPSTHSTYITRKDDYSFERSAANRVSKRRSLRLKANPPRRIVGETINWATNYLCVPEAAIAINETSEAKCPLHDHDCMKKTCGRVIINVSGMHFETQLKTLNRLPHTLLGDPERRQKYWDERRQEFFFDRHRPTFQAVLYYYQSGGRLTRPMEVPPDVFLDELSFYELGGSVMETFKRNECHLVEKSKENHSSGWKQLVWDTLETPDSSWFARIVVLTSVLVIIVSVGSFCLETLPELDHLNCMNVSVIVQRPDLSKNTHTVGSPSVNNNNRITNSTRGLHSTSMSRKQTSRLNEEHSTDDFSGQPSDGLPNHETVYRLRPNYGNPFFIIECCCVAWFTVEYVLRFLAYSSRIKFLKNFMNFIDLLAIIPFFVTLTVTLATDRCMGKGSGALSILRVVRVLRVFKLGKHSQGLQILGKTLTTSVKDLTMFMLFLIVAIVIFSSAMYYAENDINPTRFASIPDSFWYSLVTITTVGYGEVYPISIPGKIIGSVCVLAGVLTIALPVPIIVTNFNKYYAHATGRGK